MNYIQRAWLYVLQPVKVLINDKLSHRSGYVGKIARFFRIGPREYGTNYSTKFLSTLNFQILNFFTLTTRQPHILKTFFRQKEVKIRRFQLQSIQFWLILMLGSYFYLFGFDSDAEGNYTLRYLKQNLHVTPFNALNFRQSAHYSEINSYYNHQMMEIAVKKAEQLRQERQKLTPTQRQTIFARPGYVPILIHSKVAQK